jgi:hypothetical protein
MQILIDFLPNSNEEGINTFVEKNQLIFYREK